MLCDTPLLAVLIERRPSGPILCETPMLAGREFIQLCWLASPSVSLE
jgi:hypothetical protein